MAEETKKEQSSANINAEKQEKLKKNLKLILKMKS